MATAAASLAGTGWLPGFGDGHYGGIALAFTLLRPLTDEEADTLDGDLHVGVRAVGAQVRHSSTGTPLTVTPREALWIGPVWVCRVTGTRDAGALRQVAREVMDICFPGEGAMVAARLLMRRDGSVSVHMVGRHPTYGGGRA